MWLHFLHRRGSPDWRQRHRAHTILPCAIASGLLAAGGSPHEAARIVGHRLDLPAANRDQRLRQRFADLQVDHLVSNGDEWRTPRAEAPQTEAISGVAEGELMLGT